MKKLILFIYLIFLPVFIWAEDGYRLWLRYDKIDNPVLLSQYRNDINAIVFPVFSPTLQAARNELLNDLQLLLDKKLRLSAIPAANCIVAGTPASSEFVKQVLAAEQNDLGEEGYLIRVKKINEKSIIIIAANKDIGVLYGVFAFLRLLQTHQSLRGLSIRSVPKIQNRILNHWDNLNGTVERGYAGASIWNWHELPDYIDKRYIDYARANASIGINGTVLTNVNANPIVLTKIYLQKVKALADVFRPFGLKVYLTARFSAPIEIGGLKTADPLDPSVQSWWQQKCDEIYSYIPDFGGFLVKANSEGQPGPQAYGRTHAEGANMLAMALAPHGGLVIWRAFVYNEPLQKKERNFDTTADTGAGDRVKQAFLEFKPLDGQFRKNVLVQVKNGPLDFQPREPFSPLFGGMTKTSLAMEFQITQEYLGQGTHLVYEAPLFKEVLDADTYTNGKGAMVGAIVDGSLFNNPVTAISGVSNIGSLRNWTNHPFGQANWYAYGKLAWDHDLSSEQIADEWLRQTFTNNPGFINPIRKMMLASRETLVNYMTPLGLNHIMGTGHHYGPAPWVANTGRADWNPVYFHRADSTGIGFDRTGSGSNALSQYSGYIQHQWGDVNTCDEKYLLWFHHVPWNFKMKSGRNLWEELCFKYNDGVQSVRAMQLTWNSVKKFIDEERYEQVKMLLAIQENESVWWRNACLLYFQPGSGQPVPAYIEKPDHPLEYYKELRFPYAPGIGGNL